MKYEDPRIYRMRRRKRKKRRRRKRKRRKKRRRKNWNSFRIVSVLLLLNYLLRLDPVILEENWSVV